MVRFLQQFANAAPLIAPQLRYSFSDTGDRLVQHMHHHNLPSIAVRAVPTVNPPIYL